MIVPSGRRDEIGVAEARLAEMQKALRDMLAQRRHLADLGLAVSKINHDLRNILASAQLFSDRIGAADDPVVKRFAPKIIGAIDRAIEYTRSVLAYGQAKEEPPRRQLLSLSRLVDDVADVLALPGHERVQWENRVGRRSRSTPIRSSFFACSMNLCRNALEAVGDGDDPAVIRRVWVEGERSGSVATIRVCDTGPACRRRRAPTSSSRSTAPPARAAPASASPSRRRSSRAHGGEIGLVDRAGAGAVFEVTIPDRPVSLDARRQGQRS